MTKPKVLISQSDGIMKGYLIAFAYGLYHSDRKVVIWWNDERIFKSLYLWTLS
jgi:hypothetical protein